MMGHTNTRMATHYAKIVDKYMIKSLATDTGITEGNPTIWNYLVTIGLPSALIRGVRPAPYPDLTNK